MLEKIFKNPRMFQHLSPTKSYVARQDIGAGDMDWMRGKILLRPDDQLQLTEAVRSMSVSTSLRIG